MASTTVEVAKQQKNAGPGGRRGRGNRGRGGRNNKPNDNDNAPTGITKTDHPGIGHNLTKSPTALDTEENADTTKAPTESELDSNDVCWICAETIKFYAISECNHRMCHICALRLRALYKKQECAFCKHPQPSIIFTLSSEAPFSDYDLNAMPLRDVKLSIYFETEDMMVETFAFLRYNCPESDCDYFASSGWNDLKAHIRGVHSKSLCELCIRFKKVFVHEHALYTRAQLVQHMPSLTYRAGSSTPKGLAEGGVHPICEFCRECYFGDDELFVHMRESHEECFICKKAGVRDQYFRNYESLEEHFRNDHFPCNHSECLAKKFVVFGSSMDLQAHMMDEHGTSMTARDKKEARRVVAEFDFEEIPGSGGRRRREREPPPPANQHGSRPNRRDGFGAALTTTGTQPTGSNAPLSTTSASTPSFRRESPQPATEPVDPELAQRHAVFVSRFNSYTNNSVPALQAAKSAVRSYRASESTARDLITTIYNVLEQDLNGTSTLVNNIVDLLDDEVKKKDLLSSLNGFKVEQRNQFPDLVPTVQGSAYAGVSSGRALNIKHVTATRSSTRVWDRVAQAAGASPPRGSGLHAGPSSTAVERFPALANLSFVAHVPASGYRQTQRSTPWASTSAASAAAAGSSISSRMASEQMTKPSKSSGPPLTGAAFPSLPVIAARSKPAVSGNQSLKKIINNSAPSTNAWTASNSGTGADTSAPTSVEDGGANAEGSGNKSKRKKGKEKVTLFTLGAHAMSQT